jgi:hypothetical protein
MLEVSPVQSPATARPERPIREYRAPSRVGLALRLVLVLVATTLVVGVAAAGAFAGLLYRLSSIGR